MGMKLDHLVVGARTLEEGAAWCQTRLGVLPAAGGRHALFGTHNRLLSIVGAEFADAYLEIIALDPDAPPPGRPRWFGLDDADFSSGPRLIHVVARCDDLAQDRQRLLDAGQQPGEILAASRQTPSGTLSWQILVRPDGALLYGGALPSLIQWQGRHPAQTLPPSGVALQSVVLRGLPDVVRDKLGLQRVEISSAGAPSLAAVLTSPLGTVVLESA